VIFTATRVQDRGTGITIHLTSPRLDHNPARSNNKENRMKARSQDRRSLSADDIEELLGITRVRVARDYDPLFWHDLSREVRVAGRKAHERMAAWRVNKDLSVLRKHGWFPTGEGLLWVQLQSDIADDRLVWLTRGGRYRLLQTCRIMSILAQHNVNLCKIAG
jgi:hypothetical protein